MTPMTDDNRSWPDHIDYALARWEDPNQEAGAQITAFARSWGGLDLTACIRARQEGEKGDRLFALFALSHLEDDSARTLVRQALHSADAEERWVSAIGLGEAGDKHALPVLCTILTEFFPNQVSTYSQGEGSFYFAFRAYAPGIIGGLGEPLAVPSLRQSLEQLVSLLDQQTFQPIDAFPHVNPFTRTYVRYEDDIVYALGRLGAFGALTGLAAAEPWLRLWMLHLIMGHLHGAYPWQDMVRWRYHQELEMDIRHLLMFRFGLTLPQQDELLDHYERTKLRTLYPTYEAERVREQGDLKW